MLSKIIRKELQRGVDEGCFPGAVALVGYQNGDLIAHEAIGVEEPEGADISTETTFDLASISKACGTTILLMRAAMKGLLQVEKPVSYYLPYFGTENGRDKVEVRHLLTHTSGLPWWVPFYQKYTSEDPNAPKPYSKEAKRDILYRAGTAALEARPGERSVYSDLNFLLLGDLVEVLYQKPQEEAYQEEIATPLQSGCHYRPLSSGKTWPSAAPTEICQIRGGRVRGIVHDENTWVMGGVAGHAGLFGRAQDLFKIACALRPEGFISSEVLAKFWPEVPPFVGTFVLGWDTPSASLSSAGRYFSARSVGHLGFTGTAIWIDRERQLVSILLTNRVYFGRQNDKIKAFRRQYHDALGEALGWDQIREQ
jgi:CubicO group peptidase (beta-lactamase class C family)